MNHPLVRKGLPHVIAIVVFLAVSAFFCKPALEGNVLQQHDNVGWKGMAQNSFEYQKEKGHYPLWNPHLFSGMPNYQVAMGGDRLLPDMTSLLSLGLPKPMNFFFLAAVCFYILGLALGIRPLVSMLGALAFAFSTYNPVIVAAGHDTQMLATAFMPLLMAGVLLIFHRQYWLGAALTTFGAYQQIAVNHLQVTYYLFLIIGLVTLAYLVKWIREKEWKHMAIAAAIALGSALLAVAGNALVLQTTYEYSAFTMRGGKDIAIEGDSVKVTKTKGLDTAYAFEYSLGRAEALTFLMPNSFGGHSGSMSSTGSHIVSKLTARGVPDAQAEEVAQSIPRYWGLLYTSGPAYFGVIIVLLALIGVFILRVPLRWGLLAAAVLGTMLAWGKYLPGFNTFLFEHLPLYNKFRSPAFAQVIPQFCVGVLAVLSLQQLLFAEKSRELVQNSFKKILYICGGLFGVLALFYLALDYSSPIDKQILAAYSDKNGSDEFARLIVSGLKQDRKALFGGQLLRALGLSLVVLGVLWLYARQKMSALVAGIVLLVVSTLDVVLVSKAYLPEDNYTSPDSYTIDNFAPTALDTEILKDKDPHYRVFNMMGTSSGSPFSESRTSYYHRSVGGYHPAKLRIYQDIIEKYLSGAPNAGVINMLNTRYIIVPDPQSQQPQLIRNSDAFGPAWLVKQVVPVKDRAAAIKALGSTNLRDSVIVEEGLIPSLQQPAVDSASSIRLTRFDNDTLTYEAQCNGNQFAVFSEIYYPKGWNAYVNGKKTPYYNVNYILRGMPLPAGKHTIQFIFEPESVKSGNRIMFISSGLITLVLLGGLFMGFRQIRRSQQAGA